MVGWLNERASERTNLRHRQTKCWQRLLRFVVSVVFVGRPPPTKGERANSRADIRRPREDAGRPISAARRRPDPEASLFVSLRKCGEDDDDEGECRAERREATKTKPKANARTRSNNEPCGRLSAPTTELRAAGYMQIMRARANDARVCSPLSVSLLFVVRGPVRGRTCRLGCRARPLARHRTPFN